MFTSGEGAEQTSVFHPLPWEGVLWFLDNPQQRPKHDAWWFIPSSCMSRSREKQREEGEYWGLVADFDKVDLSIEQVKSLIVSTVGDVQHVIYATKSSIPTHRRWRVIIPLRGVMNSVAWEAHQHVLADILQTDRSACRLNQLHFLPNRGEHYESYKHAGELYIPNGGKLEEAAKTYHNDIKNIIPRTGANSFIGAFNQVFSIEHLLRCAGYLEKNGHWRSPYQTSDSYATRMFDGYWVSLSESDAAKNLGQASVGGTRFGDAYDLYIHYRSFIPAVAALKTPIIEEPSSVNGHPVVFSEKGLALLEEQKAAIRTASPGNPYTTLPEPPPVIKTIADWVYSRMVFQQRDLAITAAWLIAASMSGRKDNYRMYAPRIKVVLMARSGSGKSIVGSSHRAFLRASTYRHQGLLAQTKLAFGTNSHVGQIKKVLSTLQVISEAGVNRSSTAGDKSSLLAAELENISREAYDDLVFTLTKESSGEVIGANVSVLEESADETMADHLATTLSSGEVARSLIIRIDGTAIEHNKERDAEVPKEIADLATKLTIAALEGELDPPEVIEGEEWKPGPHNLIPVERRNFYIGAKELMDRLEAEEFARRKERANSAGDQENAQRTRYCEKIGKLALIAARTRVIASANVLPYMTDAGPRPQLRYTQPLEVTVEEVMAAKAMVDACHGSDINNAGDYGDPYEAVIESMHKAARRWLANPGKVYKDKNSTLEHRDRIVNGKTFGNSWERKINALIFKMAKESKTTGAEIIRRAAQAGSASGKWEYEPLGGGKWRIAKVDLG